MCAARGPWGRVTHGRGRRPRQPGRPWCQEQEQDHTAFHTPAFWRVVGLAQCEEDDDSLSAGGTSRTSPLSGQPLLAGVHVTTASSPATIQQRAQTERRPFAGPTAAGNGTASAEETSATRRRRRAVAGARRRCVRTIANLHRYAKHGDDLGAEMEWSGEQSGAADTHLIVKGYRINRYSHATPTGPAAAAGPAHRLIRRTPGPCRRPDPPCAMSAQAGPRLQQSTGQDSTGTRARRQGQGGGWTAQGHGRSGMNRSHDSR